MLKILPVGTIRAADAYTIEHEPVSSDDLMERAAGLCFEWISEIFPEKETAFTVVAGTGNNGGDGLVIARLLIEAGYDVKTVLVKFGKTLSDDCKLNLKRLQKLKKVESIDSESEAIAFLPGSIIVDALLGSGISRAPEGLALHAIQNINTSGLTVISIDMPSGLLADASSLAHGKDIVKATFTLTLGVPKLALMLPENEHYCGHWDFIPIGLHSTFINEAESRFFISEQNDIASFFPSRRTFSHKGTYGHALIVAGSKGKTGAAVLAANACLRSGCGLTTVHCPEQSSGIIQTAAPEAMCSVDTEKDFVSQLPDLSAYTAIAFGPGCGQHKATASTLKLLIQNSTTPLVIDADGLNILAENKTWLSFLPKNTILTPHPGEFKRLFGSFQDDFARLEGAQSAATKFNCIIVLKGAWTAVVTPSSQVFFNPSGNPGMAKGGSGDTLTGLIAGLLARKISPIHAAIAGVYLHGLAGDLAAEELGMEAMKAGDIIESLNEAWTSILS
ncbi:MAG: bifunctional ADP-dependent NAD(P)H-hydrate dehydratase/NAD(P)H-hydrate epimerase [Bacteroidetes bacterium HGW-Bacteroidetes-6]|jgi:NAD(P)H-hydrate epimerase|nr:MAG: bifunctional ADP-dependent NAD(P)H-hydrate dehydratase/NAD(P)H-hydrate epimerase [Bacteroidetes bacterium HGW-Bacteroidetes-6]